MDALQVSKIINTELTQIRWYFKNVLDGEEAASIFDSIVSCITHEPSLADAFKFAITSRRDPSKRLVRWEYDLSDNQHIERAGPDLQEILHSLKRADQRDIHLICEVRWSDQFWSLDKSARERFIHETYWGEQPNETRKQSVQGSVSSEAAPKDNSSLPFAAPQPVDLEALDFDLLKLEVETSYMDKGKRGTIYRSVEKCILAGYCRGVRFAVLDSDQHHLLLEWGFELAPDLKLIRTGSNREQAIALLKSLKKRLPLTIIPLPTPKFESLSAKEKQEVMKETIWSSEY